MARAHVGMSKFAYDLKTGAGTDASKNFFSVTGAGRRFDMIDYRTGEDGENKETTGDQSFDECQVCCPMVAGQTGNMMDFQEIINSWALGEGEGWESQLTIFDRENNPCREIIHHDNVPCTLELPSVSSGDDSLLKIRFTYKPNRVTDRIL